jgi:hypothetical protein
VSGQTYERLKAHCERHGVSVSGFVEQIVADELGPKPARLLAEAVSIVGELLHAMALWAAHEEGVPDGAIGQAYDRASKWLDGGAE